jgi:predicted negative regulator of RcsB-dependent stress response
MARHLDLEEQEQLAELRHFWKTYGDLITWVLIVALGAYAAWNGYQYWQRRQAVQAAALFDVFDWAARSGDVERASTAWSDLKQQFGSSVFAKQAGLMAAKLYHEGGKAAEAKEALRWVATDAGDGAYAPVARLRLAGLLAGEKAYGEALQVLAEPMPKDYEALVADRKGDILSLQGRAPEAAAEYRKALDGLSQSVTYRRFVDVKLASLGVEDGSAPAAGAPNPAASGARP